eukprot:Awhi_evm1s13717
MGGESWIDIVNHLPETEGLMAKRFEMCALKGCEGIEGDNFDCYETDCLLDSTTTDAEKRTAQLAYGKWLANKAHSLGMAMGLKNALSLIDELIDDFDYAINEECVYFHECHYLEKFHQRNKAIFGFEYGGSDYEIQEESTIFGFEYGGSDYEIQEESSKYGIMAKNERNGVVVNTWDMEFIYIGDGLKLKST